jgi:argininosuccinate lyase
MAIWSKGGDDVNKVVHDFTVGDDYLYDRLLAPYDILGSLAHVAMLAKVGLISKDDGAALSAGLKELHRQFEAGQWTVDASDEDVHSKLEALLTKKLGDAAKNVHTARSRNDQVLTAIRLWQKQALFELAELTVTAADALLKQAKKHEFHPLPGYTHLQRAMPSSVGMFFSAHAQALLDDLTLLDAAHALADSCPLGSGAGYGVGLPIDRAYAATLLGFGRHGGVAMADANSRGKSETATLDAAGAVVNDLSRFAADLVFFTTSECGFFTIGAGFTTGSSIMPQKRNPDVFELVRGRAAKFLGLRTACYALTAGLQSGYSRDLQDSKALLIQGVTLAQQSLSVIAAAVPTLEPQRAKIEAALTPDIYATDVAYQLMLDKKVTFRDAYREVGKNLSTLKTGDHDKTVRGRTHAGSTGKLPLQELQDRTQILRKNWHERAQAARACWDKLLA